MDIDPEPSYLKLIKKHGGAFKPLHLQYSCLSNIGVDSLIELLVKITLELAYLVDSR